MSTVHEVLDDDTDIYGVELQLPLDPSQQRPPILFFWANPGLQCSAAYEAASLQAIAALQNLYGFVVIDYSIHGLQIYRALAQRLFPVANLGAQLARLVVSASEDGTMTSPALAVSAHRLLSQVALPCVRSDL